MRNVVLILRFVDHFSLLHYDFGLHNINLYESKVRNYLINFSLLHLSSNPSIQFV